MVRKILTLVAFLAVVSITLSACGSSTTDQVQSAMTETTGTSRVVGDTGQSTATAEPTQAPAATTPVQPTPTPTEPPTPTPSPTPTTLPLNVTAKGYGQDEYGDLGYAFIVENPNTGLAVERSRYQIAAYDANGTVLKTDSGYITILFPGEKLGVGGTLYLPDDVEVAKLDVQVQAGEFEPFDDAPVFAAENVTYLPDRYFPKVTGVIKSPFIKDLSSIHVSAVAYNANDEIIGGGFTYLDFVPAQGQAAVEVSITAGDDAPARVELYASLSGLSLLSD